GFTKGGLAGITDTKLMLVAPQMIDMSSSLKLELTADGRNYVEFDCNGFKTINLKGVFHFTGDMFEPVPPQSVQSSSASAKPVSSNTPATPAALNAKDVTASFEINTNSLSNILATVEISPFKIHGLDGVSFEVKDAVVDYSDFANPAGASFPPEYQQ